MMTKLDYLYVAAQLRNDAKRHGQWALYDRSQLDLAIIADARAALATAYAKRTP